MPTAMVPLIACYYASVWIMHHASEVSSISVAERPNVAVILHTSL